MSLSAEITQADISDFVDESHNKASERRPEVGSAGEKKLPTKDFLKHYDQVHPKSIPADAFYSKELSGDYYKETNNSRSVFMAQSKSKKDQKQSMFRPTIGNTEGNQINRADPLEDEYRSSVTKAESPKFVPPITLSSPILKNFYTTSDVNARTNSASGGFYSIRVVMGLMSNLPENMRITKHRAPCALFSVTNSQTGDIEGYFVKEYSQLFNFSNVVISILLSLVRAGEVKITNFPRKSLFVREVPWRVDVRTDMLNAFFKSLYQARETPFVQNNTYVRSALDQACSALWLYDIVELPKLDSHNMCGYLMSKIGSNKWAVNYCIINGSFMDVIKNSTCPPVSKSISLLSARVISKIVFFNTTDEDERYSFEIYEKVPNKNFIVHQFSAESENMRQAWLNRLREVVRLIDLQKMEPNKRQYVDNNLPMPYKLKHSPHISAYLPESSKDNSANDLVSKIAHENSSEPSYMGEGASIEQAAGKKKKKKRGKKSGKAEAQLFDGDDFYMQISKPVESKAFDDPLITVPENDSPLSDRKMSNNGTNDNYGPEITISQPSLIEKKGAMSNQAFAESVQSNMRASMTPNIVALQNAIPNQIPKGKVFGRDPGSCKFLLKYQGDSVPSIVARSVQALSRESSLAEIGLFRISGTRTLIEALQTEFNSKGDCNFSKYRPDVHSVADLLKRYLRSLPHSILRNWSAPESQALFEQDRRGQIRILNVVLMNKNPTTIATIRRVLHLLKQVSEHESMNAMSTWNLSVALSPCLKVPPQVVQTYIQVEADLFGPISQLEWSIIK